MTAKARIIHHVTGLIAHHGSFSGATEFVKDKTGEKRLSRHFTIFSRIDCETLSAD
jgi:hypothetical protein